MTQQASIQQYEPSTTRPAAAATAPAETIEQKVARLESNFSAQQQQTGLAQQLLADPDVQQVLLAKQRNEPVRVLAGQQTQAPEPPEEPIDFDTLSPSDAALKVQERTLKEVRKIIAESQQPVLQQTQQLQQQSTQRQQRELMDKVTELRKNNPDFDSLAPAMARINQELRGLAGPEQLLALARHETGRLAPKDERQQTESERPTNSAARPPERATPREANGPVVGNAGFQNLIGRALDRIPVPQFAD